MISRKAAKLAKTDLPLCHDEVSPLSCPEGATFSRRSPRKSVAQLCRQKLDADPFSGCVFIFRTRRKTAIKLLAYDGQGFWIATKRLSKGHFHWWPAGTEPARTLRAHQAQMLLAAGNPEAEAPPAWRPLTA